MRRKDTRLSAMDTNLGRRPLLPLDCHHLSVRCLLYAASKERRRQVKGARIRTHTLPPPDMHSTKHTMGTILPAASQSFPARQLYISYSI